METSFDKKYQKLFRARVNYSTIIFEMTHLIIFFLQNRWSTEADRCLGVRTIFCGLTFCSIILQTIYNNAIETSDNEIFSRSESSLQFSNLRGRA